jgi:RND family efflux transporter MFP subunit
MLKKILLAVVILGIGFGLGLWVDPTPGDHDHVEETEEAVYRCPMHPTVVSDRPGSCPICGMDLVKDQVQAQEEKATPEERKIAYWRAPMDPNYISDEPGKSPMGMDLIPVYEDELGSSGTVQIDPVTVQNIGVKTASVVRQPLSRRIRTVGRVDYDETRMTDVNTKITGWVEKLFVDYTGQQVEKGQPLLEIYSPELVAAQEEYLTALDYQKRLAQSAAEGDVVQGAQDLLKAATRRLLYWDITDEQIAELERTRQVKRTMTLHSPQEGIVVHKAVFDGAHIKSGQHLYRIAELSKVWIYADIYEYELPWVKVDQEVEVELSYLPGKSFHGRVTYIYPFLEPKTRTVKVRMVFDNPEQELKPEMYANVEINAPVLRDGLVVPVQAVIHSGERNIIVVSLGEGRFQPREVEVGVEADGFYQVLSGVREGERIVTSAQFLIDSESNLKAAVSSLASTSPEEDHSDHQTESSSIEEEHQGNPMAEGLQEKSHENHPAEEAEDNSHDTADNTEHSGH